MLKALINLFKSKPTVDSQPQVSTVSQPTIVPETPTQTTSSGTHQKEQKPTSSAPTAKKVNQRSRSTQSQKKPTSPKTKKK